MKLNYCLADETKVELEVSEEVAAFLSESERLEKNNERYTRSLRDRKIFSLDSISFEDIELADPDTPESLLLREEENALIEEFLETLTETQRRRLLLSMNGLSTWEIAAIEHANQKSIYETLSQVQKKFQKNF